MVCSQACLHLVSRVCTCPEPSACVASNTTATSVVASLLADNSLRLQFSEPVVRLKAHAGGPLPLSLSNQSVPNATLLLSVDHNHMAVAEDAFVLDLSGWAGGWDAGAAAEATVDAISGSGAAEAALTLHLDPNAAGVEQLVVATRAFTHIGPRGGLLPPSGLFDGPLYDRLAPLATARLAPSDSGLPALTIILTFSEPCFGTDATGGFDASNFEIVANTVSLPSIALALWTSAAWPAC